MTDLAPIAGKLGSLVRLLASDKGGEVVAAAAAITRTLRSAGADIHLLAERIEHANGNGKPSEAEMKKLYNAGFQDGFAAGEARRHGKGEFRNIDGSPEWNEIAKFCQQHDNQLSTREQDFVNSVAARTVYREPTEKQAKWLEAIFLRLGGKLS